MNPELQILIQACAVARGLEAAIPLELGGPVDGSLLVRLATVHKQRKALLDWIGQHPGVLGSAELAALRKAAMTQSLLSSMLAQEWKRINAALAEAGIRLLSVKGAALSLELEGKTDAREYHDLDFIIDEADYQGVIPLMRGLGYAQDDGYEALSPGKRRLFDRNIHHLVFRKEDAPVHAEIHGRAWKFSEEAFSASTAALYARSETLSWGGSSYLVPGSGDHFAYVLSHGSSHHWCILLWVADFASLWNSTDPAIRGRFLEAVARHGLERHLEAAYLVARRVFRLEAWDSRVGRARPRNSQALAYARFCRGRLEDSGRPNGLRMYSTLRFLNGKGHLATIFAFLRAMIFSAWPVDLATLPLPDPFCFLYPLLRPLFLCGRVMERLFQRLGLVSRVRQG